MPLTIANFLDQINFPSWSGQVIDPWDKNPNYDLRQNCTFPSAPGVYAFVLSNHADAPAVGALYGENNINDIYYIGRAKNLRRRLSGKLRSDYRDGRVARVTLTDGSIGHGYPYLNIYPRFQTKILYKSIEDFKKAEKILLSAYFAKNICAPFCNRTIPEEYADPIVRSNLVRIATSLL